MYSHKNRLSFVSLLSYSSYLTHLITFEVVESLPRLDADEEKVRENIKIITSTNNTTSLNELNIDNDKLKSFYDFIKKKYVNFPQLGYFENISLHQFYSYLNLYHSNKDSFRTEFNVMKFLHGYFLTDKDLYQKDFEQLLLKKFNMFHSNCFSILNNNNIWSYIKYDEDFYNKLNTTPYLRNILLFNSSLLSNQLLIDVHVYTKELISNITNCLLFRQYDITHLVILFKNCLIKFPKAKDSDESDRSDDNNNSNSNNNNDNEEGEMFFACDEGEKFMILVNDFLCNLLDVIKQMPYLKMLALVSEKTIIEMKEKTVQSVCDLVVKNQSIDVLVIDSLYFPHPEVIKRCLLNNNKIKFLYCRDLNINITPNEIDSNYQNRNSEVCFMRFDSKCYFDSFTGIVEEDEDYDEEDVGDVLQLIRSPSKRKKGLGIFSRKATVKLAEINQSSEEDEEEDEEEEIGSRDCEEVENEEEEEEEEGEEEESDSGYIL